MLEAFRNRFLCGCDEDRENEEITELEDHESPRVEKCELHSAPAIKVRCDPKARHPTKMCQAENSSPAR